MEEEIISIFCICDDYIQSVRHQDWHNVKITTSEVLLTILTSMRFFYGNIERSRVFLRDHGYIKNMISKSALNRRIHKIPKEWWINIAKFAPSWSKYHIMEGHYLVDSFPVSICRNIRSYRCKIYQDRTYLGYNASKKEYFYGLKISVIATTEGFPVQVFLSPGSLHDLKSLKEMKPNLPKESRLYGDAAYNDYGYEDSLWEKEKIKLIAARKQNSKRGHELNDYVNLLNLRKNIETTFSGITRLLPRKLDAVTSACFEFKILGFIAAFAINLAIS